MSKSEKIFLTAILFLAGAMLFSACILHDIPLRDTAHRYAPMAEAFSAGDIRHALHPRIPALHILTSGAAALLPGCDGFTAVKISSCFWYFAGMFVLYKLIRHIRPDDRRIALWSIALDTVFPYTVQMASYGLREPAKTFFLLLSALGLVKIKSNAGDITGFTLTGIACGLGMLTRADTVLTAIAVLAVAAGIECRSRRVPLLSMYAMLISFLLSFPAVLLNFHLFKAAVPDWKFAIIFINSCGRMPDIADYICVMTAVAAAIFAGAWTAEKIFRKISLRYLFFVFMALLFASTLITAKNSGWNTKQMSHFCGSVFEGFYTFAGAFALICAAVKWYRGKLSAAEKVLLAVCFINAFINIFSIQTVEKTLYVSSRYLHPAMPLLFCFFVCGMRDTAEQISKYTGRKPARFLLAGATAALGIAMVFHIFQPTIRNYSKKKNICQRRKVLELAEMVKKDYRKPHSTVKVANNPATYFSGRTPLVYFTEPYNKISVAAYMAGGSVTADIRNADYVVSLSKSHPEIKKFRARLVSLGSVRSLERTFNVWRVER